MMKIKYILLLFLIFIATTLFSQQDKKYVVIIGSFSNINNAKIIYNNAYIKGFEPMILKMNTPKGEMYRVSAMQPSNYQQAKFTNTLVLEKMKISNAWILKVTDMEIAESNIDVKNLTDEVIRKAEIQKSNEKQLTIAKQDSIRKAEEKQLAIATQDSIRKAEEKQLTIAKQDSIRRAEEKQLAIAKQDSILKANEQQVATAKSKQDSIRNAEEKQLVKATKDSILKANEQQVATAKSKQDSIRNAEEKQLAIAKQDSIRNAEMQQIELAIAKQDSILKAEAKQLEIAKQDSIRKAEEKQLAIAKQDSIRKADEKQKAIAKQDSISKAEENQLAIAKQDSISKAEEKIVKNIDTIKTKIIQDVALNDSTSEETEVEEKIDWEDFKKQFRVMLKAILSKNFDIANNFIDENGFFAVRNFEGSKIADHYVDFKTLTDLMNYYGKSFSTDDFIYNLKYYDLKIISHEPLPEYSCNRRVFNKNGLYFHEYELSQDKLDVVIKSSGLYTAEAKINGIINSTNSGIRRSENMQLKGMYFSYKGGKLYLRVIDFSNFCD